MKKINFFIFIIILILGSSILYGLPAEDIEIINDRDYFQRMHELLQNAKKSIYVIMYSVYYYDRYPDSPSNILLRDLVEAKEKGLDVKVILEQDVPRKSGLFRKKEIQPEQHERVVEYLEQYNVPYILDPVDVTTHAKLIIVDGIYTVIGSTNWSYSALSKNHETAVIIESHEVSKTYVNYFNQNFKK